MNRIGAIIWKDFLRLRLSLGLWLLLQFAGTAYVVGSDFVEELHYLAVSCKVIVGAVGFLLAAGLVMEDSLINTRAFWRARAISGGRLLVAKAMGALLLFSVLPALAFVPAWLLGGFSMREAGLAAIEMALGQAFWSVLAFLLASITETSGQFLVRLMGAALILPWYLSFMLGNFSRQNAGLSDGLIESRWWLVLGLTMLTPLGMIVHQYLTRCTARSVVLGMAGLLLMLAVRQTWPWDFSPQFLRLAQRNLSTAAAAELKLEFDVDRHTKAHGSWRVVLPVTGEIHDAGTYLRLESARGHWLESGARVSPQAFRVTNRFDDPVPHAAVDRVAQLPVSPYAPVDLLAGDARVALPESAVAKAWTLQVEIGGSVMQGEVLGELPLRVGAELQVGASHTRIREIERTGRNRNLIVRLDERDAWPAVTLGFHSASAVNPQRPSRPAVDAFVMLRSAGDRGEVVGVREIGTTVLSSFMTGRRELIVSIPQRKTETGLEEITGWADGAVILKVRFRPVEKFLQTLTGSPAEATR